MNRSGEHLLALINDVLEMSKIEAGRITLNDQTIALRGLLSSLEDMLKLRAESKGLQLMFETAPEVPEYIRVDEGKLRQVLINLLGNAIKFTQSGRVVLRVGVGAIATTSPAAAEALDQASAQPGLFPLQFEVEDTGPGIPPSDLEAIFDAFIQSKTVHVSKGGTGLGLAISRQFVRLMGGEIQVKSILGQGTCFTFHIQVALASQTDVRNLDGLADLPVIGLAPGQEAYRILVVDDQPDNRQVIGTLLRQVGFQVQEAEHGQAAIALQSTWSPHLIWMDMRMPVMDGYEATRRIKAQPQPPVIIALTASVFEEKREAVLAAGCDDFVRKPFHEGIIFEKLSEYLGVKYIYGDAGAESNGAAAATPFSGQISPEIFQVMSVDWLKTLHEAAIQADAEILKQQIAQIPDSHAALAQELSLLVNQFDYDRIIEFIDQQVAWDAKEVPTAASSA